MADHHHHHLHRPDRLSVPPRATVTTGRSYPSFPYTPTPTPSKTRLSWSSRSIHGSSKSSISFLFLLFSLRSLYSLFPFLQSSPSFSLFPFSFLVSLLSFLLSLSFSLLPALSRSRKDPFFRQNHAVFSLSSLSPSHRKLLFGKSLLLAVVFLLRFQALRYCGAAAMILAELSGTVAAKFAAETRNRISGNNGSIKVRGFCILLIGLLLLSISWDRIDCFPLSPSFIQNWGLGFYPKENCIRIWPMVLPFLSGFLGCYEKISMNWVGIRHLDRKRVRLVSLFLTTGLLFIPAFISFLFFEGDENGVSIGNLGWPLANTVVFGVLVNKNYNEEKVSDSKREFLVTFLCTIVLELIYFPDLSLWGLLLCGLLLYIAVTDLDSVYNGIDLDSSDSISTMILKPIRHILSEKKSKKIALFLLINTAYMVVEFVAGFMSNSLGLISDACHMLFDCAALAIGLYASYISRLPANHQFNYGRGRFEVLSGYVNAVFLILVGALIVLESFERILDPQEISTNSLLIVSVGGLIVNIIGLIFFHDEHHHAHGGSGCSHSHSHHGHAHNHSLGRDHDHNHGHIGHDHSHGQAHDHSHDHDHCHGQDHDHSHGHDPCHGQNHDHGQAHDHSHGYIDRNHSHGHVDHDHSHGQDHDHSHGHIGYDHSHGHDHCHGQDHDHSHGHIGHDHSHGQAHDHNHAHDHRHAHDHSHGRVHDHSHGHIDHNMEGIFLHVLADTMGSVGVVISTLLIKYKGWLVADPASSIFISILIISSVIPLLRNSAEILLQRIPRGHERDLKKAVKSIVKTKGVRSIQRLHVWSFTNTDVIATLHLLVSTDSDKVLIKTHVSNLLQDAGVKDLTLQIQCFNS